MVTRGIVLVSALFGVALIAGVLWMSWGAERYLLDSVPIGMSESEVVAKLGAPAEVFFRGQNIDTRGWIGPSRPISHKVLVYLGAALAAEKTYIYIDEKGRVEHVFVGGS